MSLSAKTSAASKTFFTPGAASGTNLLRVLNRTINVLNKKLCRFISHFWVQMFHIAAGFHYVVNVHADRLIQNPPVH